LIVTYADLDQLKASFAAHASHLRLAFTGEDHIHVIATNRGDSPIAILRPNDDGNIWRVHSPRDGLAYCEGTPVGVAQYIARGGLIPQ
jgi:hypothetical protein